MINNNTTCSVCQENKTRTKVGTSPNKKRTYYKDEKNRSWRGRICPSCSKKKHTTYMRNRRRKLND